MGGMLNRIVRTTVVTVVLASLAACSEANLPAGGTNSSLLATFAPATATTSATGSAGTVNVPMPGEKMEVIDNPTQAQILEPGPLPERTLGKADAPVTVVEYASLTCPHCRAFHAQSFDQIKKQYIDTGKVRWILREFPIGHASGNAWLINRCAPEKEHFKLYNLYLQQQANWVSQEVRLEQIFAVAKQVGMTQEQFNDCLKNQPLEKDMTWIKQRGRQLGVSGTPTFFIGTHKARSALTPEQFSAIVEPQLNGQMAAKAPVN
jgi:protein-disulfide isomerase